VLTRLDATQVSRYNCFAQFILVLSFPKIMLRTYSDIITLCFTDASNADQPETFWSCLQEMQEGMQVIFFSCHTCVYSTCLNRQILILLLLLCRSFYSEQQDWNWKRRMPLSSNSLEVLYIQILSIVY
jgi:hypothetical protein